MRGSVRLTAATALLAGSLTACPSLTGTDRPTHVQNGVWITLTWTSGSEGLPSDRKDVSDPALAPADFCAPSNIQFTKVRSTTNDTEAYVYARVTGCASSPPLAMCLSQGAGAQPTASHLTQCGADPLLSEVSDLTWGAPQPGANWLLDRSWYAKTWTLNVFYCKTGLQLFGPPFTKRQECRSGI